MLSFVLYNDCYKFSRLNVVRNDNSSHGHKSDNQESHEKFLITYYLFRGFSCKEILLFLEAQHNRVISHRTLLRFQNNMGYIAGARTSTMTTLGQHTKKLRKLSIGQEVEVGIKLFGTCWKWKEFIFHKRLCKCF